MHVEVDRQSRRVIYLRDVQDFCSCPSEGTSSSSLIPVSVRFDDVSVERDVDGDRIYHAARSENVVERINQIRDHLPLDYSREYCCSIGDLLQRKERGDASRSRRSF